MGAALTLEALGRRWGWERTKVWRFLHKHGDAFALYRLPGSGGCLIFNKLYPADTAFSLPESADVVRIIARMRILAGNTHTGLSENELVNQLIRLCSGVIISELEAQSRVALSSHITRAYFSHCRNCESRVYDCRGVNTVQVRASIRAPCALKRQSEVQIWESKRICPQNPHTSCRNPMRS